jgi:hypothetical protein
LVTRRAINHSRAFWELKAEQVMDRVFRNAAQAYPHPSGLPTAAGAPTSEPMIEVEVREEPSPASGSSRPGAPWRGASFWTAGPARSAGRARMGRWPGSGRWAAWTQATAPQHKLLALGSLAVLTGAASVVCWHGWNQASLDLRQERTLWLLERLKGLDTADRSGAQASSPNPAGSPGAQPSTDPAAAKQNAAPSASSSVPPPPPDELWIQQLAQLPGALLPGSRQPEVLRVPVNGPLNRPAPPASGSAPSANPAGRPSPAAQGNSPELVGVVQVAGRPGSAIFQLGSSSTNALVGELIGSSGWRLVATAADSAVIERGGVQRRIAISNGF